MARNRKRHRRERRRRTGNHGRGSRTESARRARSGGAAGRAAAEREVGRAAQASSRAPATEPLISKKKELRMTRTPDNTPLPEWKIEIDRQRLRSLTDL